jgi:murein DD-endopeptidase MepM/ murein hydrolase activator NlpD
MRTLGLLTLLGLTLSARIAFAADADARSAQKSRIVAHYMAQIERSLEHGQLDASFFDVEVARAEISAMIDAGTPQEEIAQYVADTRLEAYYGFAPLNAEHDYSQLYYLPYPEAPPRLLSNGIDGTTGHSGTDRFAYDFVMPIGTPVLAARSGIVARVIDGYTAGGIGEEFKYRANAVLVLHDDGTYAEYGHLNPGVHVAMGDRVAAGDQLGESGNTGYSSGPHLHFSVRVRDGAVSSKTIPIWFRDAAGAVYAPVRGKPYPDSPQPPRGGAR